MPESSVHQMKSWSDCIWSNKYLHIFAILAVSQPIVCPEEPVPRLFSLVGVIFQVPQVFHIRKQFPILTPCETCRYGMRHLVRVVIHAYPLFQFLTVGYFTPPDKLLITDNQLVAILSKAKFLLLSYAHCAIFSRSDLCSISQEISFAISFA